MSDQENTGEDAAVRVRAADGPGESRAGRDAPAAQTSGLRRGLKVALKALSALMLLALASAAPATAAPIWHVASEPRPTAFQTSDGPGNDLYRIAIENLGSTSSGTITVVDRLPPGVSTAASPREAFNFPHSEWSCSGGVGQTVVTCTSAVPVEPATAQYNQVNPQNSLSAVVPIIIPVTVAPGTPAETATNTVTVSGGGAPYPAVTNGTNAIDTGASARFGASLNLTEVGPEGEPLTQAGGHPYALTTDLVLNQELEPGASDEVAIKEVFEGAGYMATTLGEEPKTVLADLPLGLVGDPLAAPRCSARQFAESSGDNNSQCPANTRVGVAFLDDPALVGPYQIVSIVPTPRHVAEFGFHYEGAPVVLLADLVHSARGYVVRVSSLVPQAHLRAFSLTFFGNPAAAFGTGLKETAFLTNPADCSADETARALQQHMDAWTAPGAGDPFEADFSDPNWVLSSAPLPPVEGCGALHFDPSLSFAPAEAAQGGTTQADAPSGYEANLEIPQTEAFGELATPALKTTKVALPEGLSASPSAANGLQACSDAQIALESNQPGSCPLASQIGTVKVTTPVLEETLEGQVFQGEPECSPCSEADASEGRLIRLFIQIHSEARGITIKLPGVVRANPQTGRLTTEFAQNPQFPFSDLRLSFKGGPRAPLANPQTCGTFTTVSELEPWSAPETPTKISESPFTITGCGSSMPFTPAFTAGTSSPAAAAYSPFTVTFSRSDGEQDLGAITVHTPPGLLGKIAGIARCGEPEANAGTCGPASQIGTAVATAGPGSQPFTVTGGRVYLTGPYKGQPFGLSIVVPAVAGPFNLGDVMVRSSIAVDPATSALTITSDPLPQVKDGVPFRLRSVTIDTNRPEFMFNASNCSQQAISATITGEHAIGSSEAAKSSTLSSAYAASGCANLPFKPKLTAVAGGRASKANGASFNVKIESAGLGQANIAKVDLQLPKALPTRLTTLQKACVAAVFEANPAACDEGSVIGKATVHTPVLSSPLSGPGYLVSHGGAAFPDVEFVLQGEGVTLVLDGKTDIKKGITYSRFETNPDAPLTTFETELPTGPHSALAAYVPVSKHYSLCGTRLAMPTGITGQNGAVINQTTNIVVTGCGGVLSSKVTLTRAQLLAKARKACKKKYKHKKKQRARCERQARKKYGPKAKGKKPGKKSAVGKGSR
jgi:hypothetical protein